MLRPESFTLSPPVHTVVRIKARILSNSFRSRSLRRRTFISLALTIVASGFGARAVLQNVGADPGGWTRSLVMLFTIMLAAWLFAPLVFGGQDDTVDQSRLALLPLTERDLRAAVLAASVLGFLPLVMLIVLGSVVLGYARGWASPVVVSAVMLQFLLCLLASRALSGAMAHAAKSRRGRDLALIVASLGAVGLWGATQSLAFVSAQTYSRILRVLEVLPSGMGARAIVDVRVGQVVPATVRLAGVALWTGTLYAAWTWFFRKNLVPGAIPARRRLGASAMTGRLRGVASTTPQALWRVLLAKELRYLRRSPQRRASLVVGVVLGGPFLLVQFLSKTVFPESVYLAPLAVVFSLGTVNNLLGFDAPSLWLEVTSGARFRTIVMCRSLATAPFVILPVATAATVMGFVAGFGRHYVVVLVLTLVGCGVPLGIGCLASVMVPFPQADTDDPFSNKRPTPGEGCVVGLVTGGSMMVTFVALAPVLLVALRLGGSTPSLIALCVFTCIYSWLVWFLCADFSGRRAEHRSSEVLCTLMERTAGR